MFLCAVFEIFSRMNSSPPKYESSMDRFSQAPRSRPKTFRAVHIHRRLRKISDRKVRAASKPFIAPIFPLMQACDLSLWAFAFSRTQSNEFYAWHSCRNFDRRIIEFQSPNPCETKHICLSYFLLRVFGLCAATRRRQRGSISAKCPVRKMNRAAEQSHLELSQLHHPFPILESLCGASIGADKTLSLVRELLEMALVPPEPRCQSRLGG